MFICSLFGIYWDAFFKSIFMLFYVRIVCQTIVNSILSFNWLNYSVLWGTIVPYVHGLGYKIVLILMCVNIVYGYMQCVANIWWKKKWHQKNDHHLYVAVACHMMFAALDSKGKNYKKWNQSKQLYVYPVIQNFYLPATRWKEKQYNLPEFKFDKIRRFDGSARLPNLLQFNRYAKTM